MSRSTRTLKLLDELRGRRQPMTARVLAARMGVSVRTIYRDLAMLEASGAGIVAGETGYLLDPTCRFAPPALTAAEAEALLLGLNYVDGRGHPPLLRRPTLPGAS